MKFKILSVVCALCIVAVGVFMFAEQPAEVDAYAVTGGKISMKLDVTGELLPEETYNVVSTASGVVKSVEVSEGDIVPINGTIAKVEFPAEQEVISASTGGDSYSILENIRKAQGGSLSLAEFALSLEPADVSASSNSILPVTQLKAGMSGEVISVNCAPGDALVPGTPVSVLASLSKKVTVYIPQSDIADIEIGQTCTLMTEGTDVEYSGSVTEMANTVDVLDSGQKVVKVDILPDTEMKGITGSSVDVVIDIFEKQVSVLVDTDSLVSDSVYVVTPDGILEHREIKTGLNDDYNAEVISGLAVGETVVKNPERTLVAGNRVTVVD